MMKSLRQVYQRVLGYLEELSAFANRPNSNYR